jgi:hypothetical protein
VPALFTPRANTITRVVIILLVLGAVSIIGGPMLAARSPYATGQATPLLQPIPFDHRHHVVDDGIDCLYCHAGAERSPYAGVPSTALCLGCHAQIWNDSDILAPLRDSMASGQPIAWARVHAMPDFVYFNHAIHVTRGIGCVSCHGRVDQMAAVYQVYPLTMQWCLACHRDPVPRLRPQAEITSMTWTPASPAQSQALARAYGTRRLTNCSACHR